jgi:hypothetical protein
VKTCVAEDLLHLVAARRIGCWVAREALEELGFLFMRCGCQRSVEDVPLRIEEVDSFARGALELWDAGALCVS